MELAQRLFQRKKNQYFSIEIKAEKNLNLEELEDEVSSILNQEVVMLNRVQLNAALYKMLNTEKCGCLLDF